MKRHVVQPRDGWQKKVEAQGFTFHSDGVRPDYDAGKYGTYWYEGAYYEFSTPEYEKLKKATEELHQMCLKAVEKVAASEELKTKFGIPVGYWEYIRQTIQENHPSLYGRMDLAYDGVSEPKLLEYNADTPTCLIESAVVQWCWLEDVFPNEDQFNSVHDDLIARWAELQKSIGSDVVYFAANKHMIEEFATVEYIRDTAYQAGLTTSFIDMKDIGWDFRWGNFTDASENNIDYMFKLYPWEWLIRDEFGQHIQTWNGGMLEPAWKMIISNKAILPVLWEMFPDSPYLLEAYFDTGTMDYDRMKEEWVKKPILSREGGNIQIFQGGKVTHESHDAGYGDGPFIIQKKFNLPKFDDQYAVVGSWVIGDKAAGIIMREEDSPIIIDRSRVVPHVFT